MKTTKAQRDAMRRYNSKTVPILFRMRVGADDDIIARLATVPNKAEYIRALIRKDISKTKE